MSVKRVKSEQVCEPLDTYEDMQMFVRNPPSWRSLCEELKPHSPYVIRNMDVPKTEHSLNFSSNKSNEEDGNFECPKTFCHFTPGKEKVKRQEIKKLPKALICHDMANGYHEDSFIDGSGRYEAYSFYNWAAVDTFCYFSHHLVTIPPLGWINVGHAHGVKVIGTVITEWHEGQKFWEEVLVSETKWKEFASMLVAIAKALKFDGWLLNVENKVSAPRELLQFVQYLHVNLHAQLPAAQLIWYDSVTIAGDLHWQNGLNQLNKDWFDACDGIFTNYSWSEREVAASAALAGAGAGGRRADVYIGIDVWGRNFLGGGKFNTQQAVKIAHKYGCSLAIFAPAWTYEAIPEECSSSTTDLDPAEYLQHFLLRERALWGSIWCYLNTKLPNELPFRTSFCRGQGLKRRLYGEVLCPVPWYNLRHMQYQPNSNLGPHGYLLITSPNMLGVSAEGVLRDSKGDVKLRETFLKVNENRKKSASTEINAVEDVAAQTSTAIQSTKAALTKDSVKEVLKTLFSKTNDEDEDSLNTIEQRSSPPFSLSVSAKTKTDHLQVVLIPIPEEKECLEMYLDDSYIGGSCLKINPFEDYSTKLRFIKIFETDFYVEDTLVACVVTKNLSEFEDQCLNLLLDVESLDGELTSVVLAGSSSSDDIYEDETVVYPLNETPNADFKEVQKYLLLEQPGFYIPTYNSYKWDVRYFRVRVGGARVTSVSGRAGRGGGPLLLGYLAFCDMVSTTAANEIIN